jgi:hypothetical protein
VCAGALNSLYGQYLRKTLLSTIHILDRRLDSLCSKLARKVVLLTRFQY